MATNFAPNQVFQAGDQSEDSFSSNPELSAPFEGDNTKYLLAQKVTQKIGDALTPLALDTAHPWTEFSDYIFVGDSPQTDRGAGLFEWTRTYAKVPADRIEGRQIPYTLPGLGIGDGETNYDSVVSAVNTASGDSFITTLTLEDDLRIKPVGGAERDIQEGDKIFLIWNRITGGYTNQFFTQQVVGDVTSAKVFQVLPSSPLVTGLTPLYAVADPYPIGNIDSQFRGRRPRQVSVNALVKYEYILASHPDDVAAIAIASPPIIRDESGNATDTYTVLTTPSLAEFVSQINDASFPDGYVVAQYSTVRRWHGNIWERETIYVKAK